MPLPRFMFCRRRRPMYFLFESYPLKSHDVRMTMCMCTRVYMTKNHYIIGGKGDPITRYEIQRLVLDQHHPDWDKGRESITTGETLTTTTITTTSGSGDSNISDDENASTVNPTTATTTTAATATRSDSCSASKEARQDGGGLAGANAPDEAAGSALSGEEPGSVAAAQEARDAVPAVLGGPSGSGSGNGMGDDRKQVGVWVGQRTDKMAPYHTAGGLPTYCR